MNTFIHTFLQTLAIIFPSLLVVFTFRNFFRALVSRFFGDYTAEFAGFLTLNPLAHINVPVFLLLTALLSLPGASSLFLLVFLLSVPLIGPAVYWPPLNYGNLYYKTYYLGVAITSLASTLGCMILALLSMYFMLYVPQLVGDIKLVMPFVQIARHVLEYALWFAALNLIPLPPFDASGLWLLGGEQGEQALQQIEPFGLLVIVFVFFFPVTSDYCVSMLNNLVYLMKHILLYMVW